MGQPACAALRAADLTRVLSGEIGYNSFTATEGAFQISNCNAIGDNASVSLRMISFLARPNGSGADLRNILLDWCDPDIPSLTGESVTDTAVSYLAEGDLIFWSADSMKMFIIDEDPDQMARARRIARLVATSLGLAADEVSIFGGELITLAQYPGLRLPSATHTQLSGNNNLSNFCRCGHCTSRIAALRLSYSKCRSTVAFPKLPTRPVWFSTFPRRP